MPLDGGVQDKLKRMEKDGVIREIDKNSDWRAGIIVVPMPND